MLTFKNNVMLPLKKPIIRNNSTHCEMSNYVSTVNTNFYSYIYCPKC